MRFTRVTLLLIALIIGLGFYQLGRGFLAGVEPQIFRATEEAMVDTANLLAELVAVGDDGQLDTAGLERIMLGAAGRDPAAEIFGHWKHAIGVGVYVTDRTGLVIYDSEGGRRTGMDFANMNDVLRTLRGNYGARSSREEETDARSSVMYVSAPVQVAAKGPVMGVLTVYKAQADVLPLVAEQRQVILRACGMIGGGILVLITVVFLWLFRPIGRLTEYARAIEAGARPQLPKLGVGREVNTLAVALVSMREALEGRRRVKRYTETLCHEIKSPLAAIRGAAELLEEGMPLEDRRKFLGNIRAECARAERLSEQLLELSEIEVMQQLERRGEIDLGELARQAIERVRALADSGGVKMEIFDSGFAARIIGDPFLLRAAITNLLENAIDFSAPGDPVRVRVGVEFGKARVRVVDRGCGVPGYAGAKVFERFYSLKHLRSGRKGTGLGLVLVREATDLHGGKAWLERGEDGIGTTAVIELPVEAG